MQKQSSLSSNSETFRVRYEKQPLYTQLEALTATKGHLLVIAGTGRGKAHKITNRLVCTVEDGTSADSILLQASTGKADVNSLHKPPALPVRIEKVLLLPVDPGSLI